MSPAAKEVDRVAAAAKLKMYRCMNKKCAPKPGRLGFDFYTTDAKPKCPTCGRDTESARFPITRMTLVHFDPPEDPDDWPGRGHRACDPTMPIQAMQRKDGEIDSYHAGTGSILAVTCPACKETEEFKKAVLAAEV